MIIFRTDASEKTGFGHIKRSSYLASLLGNKNEVLFLIGKDKVSARYLESKKIPHILANQWDQPDAYSVKCILFDLRYFTENDIRLIRQARQIGIKTIQITDLGLSQQDVDITIDSALYRLFPYPEDKVLFSGPEYAILHHKFRHFNKVKRKYREKIKNIFICLGGAADYQRLRQIIDLLSRYHYNLKIAGGYYLKPSARKTLKRIYSQIHFVGETDSLARSFFEADVALIAPGVAAFEAAAVGTPALYFYYHDEQKTVAHSFEEKGAGLEISNIADLLQSGKSIVSTLDSLTLDKRLEMGCSAKRLVDGLGVYRIIDIVKGSMNGAETNGPDKN